MINVRYTLSAKQRSFLHDVYYKEESVMYDQYKANIRSILTDGYYDDNQQMRLNQFAKRGQHKYQDESWKEVKNKTVHLS